MAILSKVPSRTKNNSNKYNVIDNLRGIEAEFQSLKLGPFALTLANGRPSKNLCPAGLHSRGRQMTTLKELSTADVSVIKARIIRGEKYSEIASDYRLNQGRIADIKFGRAFPEVKPADLTHN